MEKRPNFEPFPNWWRAFTLNNLNSQRALANIPGKTRIHPLDPARHRIDCIAGRFMRDVRR